MKFEQGREGQSQRLLMQASASVELAASHLDVRLQVTSSSSVRSAEASRAVAEIAELLQGLEALGVDPGQAEIQSASVAEGKGMFGRGSTARFQVVVRRVPPDLLVGVLQTATRLSHTEHEGSDWRFPLDDELREKLIGQACAKAKSRAEVAAKALEVRVCGVQHCQVSVDDGQPMEMPPMGAPAPMMARSKTVGSLQAETGIELVRNLRVTARAEVVFLVGVAEA